MLVQGRNNAPRARLVKASRLVKGFKAGQQIYVVKLNKVEEPNRNMISLSFTDQGKKM